ncbi:N-acetylmuramoyl-L-alanine amidase [Bacillus sp. FJAT-29790]|nr:N-acetylmuramoyl-L-alanine amidase [Bacillus sp. FJAT-29790]
MSYIESIAPLAIKYMKQEGILASLTIAQAILESDSGESELAVKANNLFGIKANPTWKGGIYKKKTKEFENSKWIEKEANFCNFESLEECFHYRTSMFLKTDRYKPLWGVTDYKVACRIIWQTGYATDPNYPQKLIAVIEKYQLYEYDKERLKVVKLFIDPGHGGTDSGAVGNGLQEKNLTLQICKRIRDMLTDFENAQVKLSRETDETVSLNQRTEMANTWGADFFLSVHINATPGGFGYEDHIYPGSGGVTVANQNIIHEEVVKQVDFHDRGEKQSNFHVLRESKMPALLTENGFIDNAGDAAKLKKADFIDRIARGHVNGLEKAFGLKKKTVAGEEGGKKVDPKTPEQIANEQEMIDAIDFLKQKNVITNDRRNEPLTRGQLFLIMYRFYKNVIKPMEYK